MLMLNSEYIIYFEMLLSISQITTWPNFHIQNVTGTVAANSFIYFVPIANLFMTNRNIYKISKIKYITNECRLPYLHDRKMAAFQSRTDSEIIIKFYIFQKQHKLGN